MSILRYYLFIDEYFEIMSIHCDIVDGFLIENCKKLEQINIKFSSLSGALV